MRLALVPLDERPVNTSIPLAVAAAAGTELLLPPDDVLPRQRRAGDVEGIMRWVRGVAPSVDALCICIDTLVYGGLIPARTSADSVGTALARLDLLRELRAAHPLLPIRAISLVMRASNSYSNGEEPLYWSEYGRELHRLGGELQHVFEGAAHEGEVSALENAVPAEVRRDFERRRLRNHIVNLAAMDLLADGTLTSLSITADDTNPYAAGTLEQRWLAHWRRALPLPGELLMYPGADEVGAVAVARCLAADESTPVRIRVANADPASMAIIPAYENRPLHESVSRQLRAAGCDEVETNEDLVLVVHGAHPGRLSWNGTGGFGDAYDEDAERSNAARTAGLVRELLDGGARVALADVRFTNGSDCFLVDDLLSDGSALRLTAYGGWNTAGNTIGSVVALAAAAVIGARRGASDAELRRQLVHRLLEDSGWQSEVRDLVRRELRLADHGVLYADEIEEQKAIAMAQRSLAEVLSRIEPDGRFALTRVSFPWHRTFEIDFVLEPADKSDKVLA